MLPVSNRLNFFENFEWELADHPMGMMMGATIEEQPTLESFDFFDYPLLQDHGIDGGRGDSPPLSGAGSGDDHDLQLLLTSKRKNHNQSERDRRKKINGFIPATVARVLNYIQEIQKEVEDLTHEKEELLSKADTLQGDDHDEEEKPSKKPRITKDMNKRSSSMCSVSIDEVEEKEIVIHISTSQRITSMPEMEGTKIIEHETLKEKLSTLIDEHNQASHDPCGQARGQKDILDFGTMENPSIPNHEDWEIDSLKSHEIAASRCPLNFGWEFPDYYPTEIIGGTAGQQQQQQQQGFANLNNFNLFDSCGVSDYPLLQDHDIDGGLGESPLLSGSGSGDDHDHQLGDAVLAKKRLHHNASERDRRKKINCLYSSLRALLPASELTKKLSIPATVAKILKHIPELQKEIEDLTHQKQELLSKTSAFQEDDQGEEEKPCKKSKIRKEINSSLTCSISIEEVGEREVVIHISTSQRITSLPELPLRLEKAGFLVIQVSSFQSVGGRAFYNLHLTVSISVLILSLRV
ncbi:hypothetical protein Cgig2_023381 [Carnegiea gigantea]|uniref:BHLH domain-containing protein n=1 Tax=Carnegiea gigantea TaxID=171969 RepID=A0A9Q1GMC8_9CARY|nr:hypothetical protein Cgig2_023381 [Carnegiea gigantea]